MRAVRSTTETSELCVGAHLASGLKSSGSTIGAEDNLRGDAEGHSSELACKHVDPSGLNLRMGQSKSSKPLRAGMTCAGTGA